MGAHRGPAAPTSGSCSSSATARSRASRSASALHARLEPTQVRHLLYHADRRHLAALCIAAGLATPRYITLRMAMELAEETTTRAGGRRATPTDAIRFLQVQYEKLCGDEAKLRLVLGR